MSLIKKTSGFEAPVRKEFKKGVYNVKITDIIGSDGVDSENIPRVANVREDGVVSEWVILKTEVEHGTAMSVKASRFFWLPNTANFNGEDTELAKLNETREDNLKELTHLYELASGKAMPEDISSDQMAVDLHGKIISAYVTPETEKVGDKWVPKVNDGGYVQYKISNKSIASEKEIEDEFLTEEEIAAKKEAKKLEASLNDDSTSTNENHDVDLDGPTRSIETVEDVIEDLFEQP